MKMTTSGETLLIAVNIYLTRKLTKYEGSETSFGLQENAKKIIVDQRKYEGATKVCTILQPFLNKRNKLYPLIKPILQNTESRQDFDPTKLFDFKSICIESLDSYLEIYEPMLKGFEEMKEKTEDVARIKNKIPKTKNVEKHIAQSTAMVNQLKTMKRIFSDAVVPEDLNALELYKKPN